MKIINNLCPRVKVETKSSQFHAVAQVNCPWVSNSAEK